MSSQHTHPCMACPRMPFDAPSYRYTTFTHNLDCHECRKLRLHFGLLGSGQCSMHSVLRCKLLHAGLAMLCQEQAAM